jgi:membrane associated rhomboid family serine protease
MFTRIGRYLLPLANRSFRPAFTAFLVVLIPSAMLLVLTSLAPPLYDALPASRNTPWGVFTSIFVHSGFVHFAGNMVVLFAFLFVFLKLEEDMPQDHQYKDSRFLGRSIFLCGVIANSLFLVASSGSAAGASGVVYACEGVIMGLAFLMIFSGKFNFAHLNQRQLDPQERQTLRGLAVFVVLFVFFLFFRADFLSSGPGVDVFVHFWGFLLGFTSVAMFELYNFLRRQTR